MQKFQLGAFTFEPKENGVEVVRSINSMQNEIIGTWPWDFFEKILAARPTSKEK